MKRTRVLAFFLAAVMLFSCAAVPGFAVKADAAELLTYSLAGTNGETTVEAKPGDIVTLCINISNNPGVISVGVGISYPEGISVNGNRRTPGGRYGVMDKCLFGNPGRIYGYTSMPSPQFTCNPYDFSILMPMGDEEAKLLKQNGTMAEVYLKIGEDTRPGNYPINLVKREIYTLTAPVDEDGYMIDETNTPYGEAYPIDVLLNGCVIHVAGCENHTWGEWKVTQEPDCVNPGQKTRECSVCHEIETAEISALGHDLQKVDAKEATCTENGHTEYYKCERCGKLFADAEATQEIQLEDTVIYAHHTLQKVDAVKPTCTKAGNKEYYKCTACGKLFADADGKTETTLEEVTLAKVPHDLQKVEAKAATCTEAGNKEYYKCSMCGKLFADADGKTETTLKDVTIEKLGHDLQKVEAQAATCTKAGNREYYKCERCGKLFADAEGKTETNLRTVILAKLPHTMTYHAEKPATCTEEGRIAHYSCSMCGQLYADPQGNEQLSVDDLKIDPLGHDLQKFEAKEATCTENGHTEYYKCERCGKLFADAEGTQEIQLKDTVIPAHHTLQKIEAKEATCTETGNKEYYKCTACGKLFADADGKIETTLEDVTLAKVPHALQKVEAKAATCTEAGNSEYYKCSMCGKLFADEAGRTETTQEDVTIEKLGHDLQKVEAKAATCTENGNKEYYKCSRCGKLFADAEGKTEIQLKDTVIPAHHDLQKVEAKAATCTEAGNKEYYKCTECGKLFADAEGKTEIQLKDTVIPAHHTLKKVEEKKPTCVEEGNIEYYVCTVCGKMFNNADAEKELTAKDIVLVKAPHTVEKVEAKAPTFAEAGNKEYYKCSVCGKLFADAEGKNEITKESVVIPRLVPVDHGAANVTDDAVKSVIQNAAGGKIVIDLTTLPEGFVGQADISAAGAQLLVDAGADVEIRLTNGTIKLDKTALAAAASQAGGNLSLAIAEEKVSDLSAKQKEALSKYEVPTVISLKLTGASGEIHDFNGGSAEVDLSVAIKAAKYDLYYVASDGKLEKMDSTYADGHLKFTASHFSDYAIVIGAAHVDENTTTPTEPDVNNKVQTGDQFELMFWIGVLLCAVVAFVTVVAVAVKRKRR